jgi:hypothetical protein
MPLRRLILLGFLISTRVLDAQTDFRPGYIINSVGDTLYGKIDYRSDLLMSTICKYQDVNNTIKEYAPNDIKGFRFIDSKYYVSKEINGTNFFLEYLIKGKVNIYYMRNNTGDHYYIDKEGVKLAEIPYEEGLKYVDGKEVYFRTTKHIGVINYYMQDAPQFKSRIEDLKKPDHEYLIKLAEDYHNAVCEGEKCIIYEKKFPFLKVNYEVIGGKIKSKNSGYYKNYSQVGILANFWMPRANEKLYFRTGLLYSTLEADLETDHAQKAYYKIPIQIEYVYPTGIIKPALAYGMNIYGSFGNTVALMGGVNINLHKFVSLGIYYDIDFSPNEDFQFLPKKILSQSISISFIVNPG